MQQYPQNPKPPTVPYANLPNEQHSYEQYPYYTHQPQNPNPNPNPNPNQVDPQLVLRHHENPLNPDAGLRPPGVDYSATNSVPHAHTGVGFEGQVALSYGYPQAEMGPPMAVPMAATAYYQDPGAAIAAAQNWQFGGDPVAYAAVTNSQNDNSMVPPSSNPMFWNNNGMNHPFPHAAKRKAPKKTKVVQSVWCEVCKILCNSKGVFDGHVLGKKHKTNLEKREQSKKVSNTPNSTTVGENLRTTNEETLAIGQDLETKKRQLMEGGATADSVKANMRLPSGTEQLVNPTLNPINGAAGKGPNIPSISCEICLIYCDTKEVLELHKMGKKHKKKMEATSATVPITNVPIIGPRENPEAETGQPRVTRKRKKKPAPSGSIEDLEMKRRKVLESGADSEAVKICTICNVVCNSETVFNYHIVGHKHIAMVNKQTAPAVTA